MRPRDGASRRVAGTEPLLQCPGRSSIRAEGMPRFPVYRPRRLRRSEALRRLVRETRVTVEQLVQPLFVVPGRNVERPVGSMPGVAQLSVDRAAEEARALADLGVPAVLLFGVPERKDARGSGATDPDGIVPRAL